MGRKFTSFALFHFVFEGKFQVQAPRGSYIRRGDLTEKVFCVTILGGFYLEGLICGILRYSISFQPMYGAWARIGGWNAEVNVVSTKRNRGKIKKKIRFVFFCSSALKRSQLRKILTHPNA